MSLVTYQSEQSLDSWSQHVQMLCPELYCVGLKNLKVASLCYHPHWQSFTLCMVDINSAMNRACLC